jgi:hypothetical protein
MSAGHLRAVVVLLTAACGMSPAPPPVPVEGAPADLATLAGEWSGRYWGEGEARYGTLTFRLRAGADTARGQVEMSFSPALRLYGESKEEPLSRTPCTTIDIAIVRVQGNTVRGTLAPYWDPDCECRTRTVFEGEVMRDSIAGTFTSHREVESAPVLKGIWFAVRYLFMSAWGI